MNFIFLLGKSYNWIFTYFCLLRATVTILHYLFIKWKKDLNFLVCQQTFVVLGSKPYRPKIKTTKNYFPLCKHSMKVPNIII